jgi:hypothetical protein
MFTAGPHEITHMTATFPGVGVWSAFAVLAGGLALPLGRVSVLLGDLELSGTVRRSDAYGGRAEALIIGGADGWAKIIGTAKRPYRADNGVRLRQVAEDLGLDAGEAVEVLADADRSLGYAWTRPAGAASSAADDLGVPWWVGVDGNTRFGARPAVELKNLKVGVRSFSDAARSALLSLASDELRAVVPGTWVSGDALPRRRVRASVLMIDRQTITAEISW